MIVFHVCSLNKFLTYLSARKISSPVRAWTDVTEAKRFSIQTGRQIILRLKFPSNVKVIGGHKGKAVVLHHDYLLENIFGNYKFRRESD